jgi:hypothetical protein
MSDTTQFDKAYSTCEIQILRDEDWRDSIVLQRLTADGSQANLDFSDVAKLELFIRPLFDHDSLIKKLSSDPLAGGEIQFDRAVAGAMQITMSRANVIAQIPTGTWVQFLDMTHDSGVVEELWRGPLIVYPGKITP